MKSEEQRRSLFGISLSERPRWQQFVICSSGFFFGYLVNGVCEEYVYNRLQFSYGWYFTFVQGWVYILLIYLQGFTTKQMVNPWKTYVKLSAVLMGSNGLTKGSLAFLNYPAQLMFKSTKVLPVMIMGAFIPGLRRKYPPHEYLSAVLLVVGLILFTLADAQTSPNFSGIGVLMVSGALIMDAFLGNLQEAIFTMNPETTQMEMLFCSTLVGMPFLIPPMLVTGELFKAWDSCSKHLYVYGVLVFEAMATFIGQVSVLSLIALFGAATTAMPLIKGKKERPKEPWKGEFVKSIVYAGLDAIVTSFSLISSISAGRLSSVDVLVLGFANLVADGISMGFGDFVSSSTERDVASREKSVTEWDVENHRRIQQEELVSHYLALGMNADDASSRKFSRTCSH